MLGFTDTFHAVYMIHERRDREHGHLFLELQEKIFKFGTCHFKIIARNMKAIFSERL